MFSGRTPSASSRGAFNASLSFAFSFLQILGAVCHLQGCFWNPLSALVSLGWGNSNREGHAGERLETGFLLSLQPQTRTLTSMTHQHQGIPKSYLLRCSQAHPVEGSEGNLCSWRQQPLLLGQEIRSGFHSRLAGFPRGIHVLIPGTCGCVTLYGKWVSAVVIKLGILT